jgi:hypothetical protein
VYFLGYADLSLARIGVFGEFSSKPFANRVRIKIIKFQPLMAAWLPKTKKELVFVATGCEACVSTCPFDTTCGVI